MREPSRCGRGRSPIPRRFSHSARVKARESVRISRWCATIRRSLFTDEVRMRSVARVAFVLAAGFLSGAGIPHRACAQDTGFVAWPRELASRAPALADGMAREFGQPPRMIAFGGRDTVKILFWNPTVWQDEYD